MKKNKFTTTNNLRFKVNEKSLFKGFAAFKMGEITGHFQVNNMSIDFVIGDWTIEHLPDVIEWFSEMARQETVFVRAIGVNSDILGHILIRDFGFTKMTVNSYMIQKSI